MPPRMKKTQPAPVTAPHVDSGLDGQAHGQARDFDRRQLNDWKGSAEIEQTIPKGVAKDSELCRDFDRAHASSGDWIPIASYLRSGDSFDRAITRFG
jgi:hypothetical protein